ncbi:hypothetical protein O181_064875, partial [Austropuccinia psidii MF-1]|nr:hypothetical protein [Austropuccinia psidii MF-1]
KPRKRSGKYGQAFGRGYEPLLTNQELSGSEEDHGALRRMNSIVFQGKGQKDKELIEEPRAVIHRPEARIGNDPSFVERRPSGVNQLHNYHRTSPKDLIRIREVPRTIKEREKEKKICKELTHKGTGSPNWSL